MGKFTKYTFLFITTYFISKFCFAAVADSVTNTLMSIPTLKVSLGDNNNPADVVNTLKIIGLLTLLTLAPSILIMMTSFTRIVVVLSFLRQAVGTQQLPPNQLIIGLALFLTFFIMTPVFKDIYTNSLDPYMKNQITQEEAWNKGLEPIRKFMFAQTRNQDLKLFIDLTKTPRPQTKKDVPTTVLIPAFMISELKTAFEIGFILYVPFLIIDMVIASILMAMGMMMLPPIIISLPFKIMLFVLIDGWQLIVGSLIKSFN